MVKNVCLARVTPKRMKIWTKPGAIPFNIHTPPMEEISCYVTPQKKKLRQMCMFLTFAEIWVNNLVESKNKTSFPKAVNFPDASSIMNKILQRRSYSRARSRPSGWKFLSNQKKSQCLVIATTSTSHLPSGPGGSGGGELRIWKGGDARWKFGAVQDLLTHKRDRN